MRLLALQPEGMVIPFIHASMVKAFRSLGVEVLDLPFPQGEEDLPALKSAAGIEPAAVFTVDLPPWKNKNQSIKSIQSALGNFWIIWFVDDPEGYAFPESCDPARTIVFCWDREIVKALCGSQSWKGIPPIYLPLAADPEVFYPGNEGLPPSFPGGVFVGSTAHSNPFLDGAIGNSPGFEEDVSRLWALWEKDLGRDPRGLAWEFLRNKTGIDGADLQSDTMARLWVHSAVYGLGRRKRMEVVARVIGEGGGLFGDHGWGSTMARSYRGEIAYGEELRRLYSRSAFALDVRPPQSRTGLTQRIFDAGACEIPVLADFSPELESLFDAGQEVFFFRTLEEAEGLGRSIRCDLLGSHAVGKRAGKRILASHTYRHRAQEILGVLHRFLA